MARNLSTVGSSMSAAGRILPPIVLMKGIRCKASEQAEWPISSLVFPRTVLAPLIGDIWSLIVGT